MSVGRWGGGIYAEGDRNMSMDDGRGRLEGGASTRAENMHFHKPLEIAMLLRYGSFDVKLSIKQ